MRFNPFMLCAIFMSVGTMCSAVAEPIKIGAATYLSAPRSGDRKVPEAVYRTDAMLKTPAQTAQWYSTLLYNANPEAIYAQPLTIKPTPAGVEVSLATKMVVPTERRDTEIHYPHRDPIVVSPVAFALGQSKLARADDWSIDISMARTTDEMLTTIAHGSPYAFFQLSRGDVRIQLPKGATGSASANDGRILNVSGDAKHYAVFGPAGIRWTQVSPSEWIGTMPTGKTYLALAALPDGQAETLALFTRHAYTHIRSTRVAWNYNAESSSVETTFTATTHTHEGPQATALLGLYPHHWLNNASVESRLGLAFQTVRGSLRLLAANTFSTKQQYIGFVPFWPGIKDPAKRTELADIAKTDQRNARRMMLEEGKGPYWQGKGLQRILKVMDVVEQQGDKEGRDKMLDLVKKRAESWFTGEGGGYFHLDKGQGTVASYPEEFFTVEQLNDHHFTYGYWIRAAADIALRDPEWAATGKWGAMVDLLIADIATPERSGSMFPFLRTFDPYEGHSWASGIGLGAHGNNQESSSEAINAWAGIILWAEIKGDTKLRDLGIYLYTNEIEAINHYWFDIYGKVFAPEYKNAEVSQLFGGMYSHNTWWIDDPRSIKGINLLPITTSSTYLGIDPAFVKRSVATLGPETEIFKARGKFPKPPDIWQDIFAKYLALADPEQGMQSWDRWGTFELGDTRTHALHWLQSLKEMGTPDFSVTADTTLYAVFKRKDGARTYLAYNAGAQTKTVKFSDGRTLTVAPGTLAKDQ